MFLSIGLIAAFIALFCWGFGDFFMQRTIRAIGKMEALFFITIFGVIVLFPWVKDELTIYLFESRALFLLGIAALITLVAAYMQFSAFETGKLAAVEPAMSLELPATVAIGVLLLGERLNVWQLLLMTVVFVGVLGVSLHRHEKHWWWRRKTRHFVLEAGVVMAGFSAIAMAGTNIMTGLASRGTSPLVTIWFVHALLAVISFIWIWLGGSVKTLAQDFKSHAAIIIAVAIFDTSAWIAYGYAVLSLPMALTIGITESYVALAAFLGLRFNHEKLERHQIIGGLAAIVASVLLAFVSN
ncbi:MAG: DMT family transporter [Candidatus Komeilibacteria bacterium]